MKVYLVLMVCLSALTLVSCWEKDTQNENEWASETSVTLGTPGSQREEMESSDIWGGQWEPDELTEFID